MESIRSSSRLKQPGKLLMSAAFCALTFGLCVAHPFLALADSDDSLRITPDSGANKSESDSLRIPPPGSPSALVDHDRSQSPPASQSRQDADSLRITPFSNASDSLRIKRSDDNSAAPPDRATQDQASGQAVGSAPTHIGALDVPTLSQTRALIPNLHVVTPGLIRGGQPTLEALLLLRKAGVKTILNLRNEDILVAQEASQARMLGLNYVNVPLGVFDPPSNSQIRKCLATLTDAQAQPVFVHCLHGQDRTGTIVALYRIDQQGWAADQAYQEMLAVGFRPMFGVLTKTVFDFSAKHGRVCQPPAASVVVDDVKQRLTKFMHH